MVMSFSCLDQREGCESGTCWSYPSLRLVTGRPSFVSKKAGRKSVAVLRGTNGRKNVHRAKTDELRLAACVGLDPQALAPLQIRLTEVLQEMGTRRAGFAAAPSRPSVYWPVN